MENLVDPLTALESLGFKPFYETRISALNKKMYVKFSKSFKFGIIARVGYPSVGKSSDHIVEYYKIG